MGKWIDPPWKRVNLSSSLVSTPPRHGTRRCLNHGIFSLKHASAFLTHSDRSSRTETVLLWQLQAWNTNDRKEFSFFKDAVLDLLAGKTDSVDRDSGVIYVKDLTSDNHRLQGLLAAMSIKYPRHLSAGQSG